MRFHLELQTKRAPANNGILSDLVLLRPQPFPARTGLELLSFRVLAGNCLELRRSSFHYVAEAVPGMTVLNIDNHQLSGYLENWPT